MATVLVFAEQRDGRLKKAALEVLSQGRRLADGTGGRLVALLVGEGVALLAAECAEHGADEVLAADGPGLATYAS